MAVQDVLAIEQVLVPREVPIVSVVLATLIVLFGVSVSRIVPVHPGKRNE